MESAQERQAVGNAQVADLLERTLRRRPPSKGVEHSDSRETDFDPFHMLLTWSGDQNFQLSTEIAAKILRDAVTMYSHFTSSVVDMHLPHETARIVIVGDLHGQFPDALHILREHGPPSDSVHFLFNGDISDRGDKAVEIWLLLLAFKLRHPERLHILRGNHEHERMNERARSRGGGFTEECLQKYGPAIHALFQELFVLLPLFAVIEREVFVVHGGLFRQDGVSLDQLRRLPYKENVDFTHAVESHLDPGPGTDLRCDVVRSHLRRWDPFEQARRPNHHIWSRCHSTISGRECFVPLRSLASGASHGSRLRPHAPRASHHSLQRNGLRLDGKQGRCSHPSAEPCRGLASTPESVGSCPGVRCR